ncbi:MAG: GrdX protein [Alkaliphilus sp.]|nr:GrdX family protein [Alkaliphilus sp. AH-315-G20]PHS32793.1 MAG: GrdX protein [Alkaliphilus sp.]
MATIITNNPLVLEKMSSKIKIDFRETDLKGILIEARNRIHAGHKLLSHPLSGSVKPNETNYKSLMISDEKAKLDLDSLRIIESAIETTLKFLSMRKYKWESKVLDDFQEIDFTLISSAVESMI